MLVVLFCNLIIIRINWSNYRIPAHKETLLVKSGPGSRSDIAKRIMKTATVVCSPIVKDHIIIAGLPGEKP